MMKFRFLLFLLPFLTFSAFSQITFDRGATFYTDSSKTTLCNGKFRKFYPGYKIKMSTNYLNGKLEGESTEHFENGQVKILLHFKNGLLDGEAIEYYPETLLMKSKFIFSNGLKNGECFLYKENGDVLERKVYTNDVLQR